jgi:hypothetical protein
MKPLLLCPQWGLEHLPMDHFLSNVKEAATMVETWMPESSAEIKELMRLLGAYHLPIVCHQHQANEVVNSINNSLVGDAKRPAPYRNLRSNIGRLPNAWMTPFAEAPLVEAGLIGPVTLKWATLVH